MQWLWQVKCNLCGYKSAYHHRPVADTISMLHTFLNHPHGYNTIQAAEAYRIGGNMGYIPGVFVARGVALGIGLMTFLCAVAYLWAI